MVPLLRLLLLSGMSACTFASGPGTAGRSTGIGPVHASATVDLTAPSTDFNHYWKRCVGSGHLLLGTRRDWQDHLRLAHAELGFTGIRGHGLLDDDVRTCNPTKHVVFIHSNCSDHATARRLTANGAVTCCADVCPTGRMGQPSWDAVGSAIAAVTLRVLQC